MTDKHRERADTEWAREEAEKIALEIAGAGDARSVRISIIQTALLAAEQRGREAERAERLKRDEIAVADAMLQLEDWAAERFPAARMVMARDIVRLCIRPHIRSRQP